MIAARAFYRNGIRIFIVLQDHPFFERQSHLPLLDELASYDQIDLGHEMIQFFQSGNYEIVFYFTQLGVDINYLGDPTFPDLDVLSFAIGNTVSCSLECLKTLIEAGAIFPENDSMLKNALLAGTYQFAEYLIEQREPLPDIWQLILNCDGAEHLLMTALQSGYPIELWECTLVIKRFLELVELENAYSFVESEPAIAGWTLRETLNHFINIHLTPEEAEQVNIFLSKVSF